MTENRHSQQVDTTGGGGATVISVLVGTVIAGVLIVTLGIPIVAGGGNLWLAPALAWGAAALYLLFDRRLARAEAERDSDAAPAVRRWTVAFPALFFVFYTIAVLATGHPVYLVPAIILAALAIGYGFFNRWLVFKQLERHGGDAGAAMADGDDPWPGAPHIPDEARPLGDTPEAHDEINPHDVPKWDRSTRRATERLAGGLGGTTGGHTDGGAGGEEIPSEDETAERVGGPQRSAARAKP